jgi:serine/threonine protein kinase
MGLCINSHQYLMITEFMPGGSLFDLLHKRSDHEALNSLNSLNHERILGICEDIALGMNYLHSRQVLHCDLKSSNVLVKFLINFLIIGGSQLEPEAV